MQNHFFRCGFAKEQHVQKITFRVVQWRLTCFHVWFFYGHRTLRRARRTKTVSFEVKLGRNDIFRKILFEIVRRAFEYFSNTAFQHTQTFNQALVDLEKTKYRLRSEFAEEQRFQKGVLFSELLANLVLFSNVAWRWPNFVTFCQLKLDM